MKRFTDTDKFSDPWFRKLAPEYKLAWIYLLDLCDNSGVADLDRELADFQIGIEIDWEGFLRECHGRVDVLTSGKWFIPTFVSFQCKGVLSENCKPHQHILKLLEKHGIPRDSLQRVSIPLAKGPGKGKGKGSRTSHACSSNPSDMRAPSSPPDRAPSTPVARATDVPTRTPCATSAQKKPKNAEITAIVEHYQTKHPRSRPGKYERKKIADRLKEGYEPADLIDAINGNHVSPHHCGFNEAGTKYHNLSLIFRSASHVDMFVECWNSRDQAPRDAGEVKREWERQQMLAKLEAKHQKRLENK